MTGQLAIAALLAALSSATSAEARPTRVFAVVMGNNAPHTPAAARLTYADDDAVRMLRLFDVLPGRATLLTRMDGPTRAAHPDLAERARPPTVANLRAAIDEMVPYMLGARDAGWDTAFYLFFAGHGDRQRFDDVDAELSYIYIDEPMSSRDLYEIVDDVPADTRHVLIDACHSLDLVTGRGQRYPDEPEVDLAHVVGDFLDARSLRRRPGIGVVVSTTPENTALESRTLRSGIFTHVVRSGMLGAADLNGDRRVSYGEIEAFTRIATTPTDETPRGVFFFSEPPRGDRQAALIDLRRAEAPALYVPAAQQTRFEVHTPDGGAYAGFYGAPNIDTRVLLVGRDGFVLLRWDRLATRVEGELELRTAGLAPRTVLRLHRPDWLPAGTADVSDVERGAARALFREPFGHTLEQRVLEQSTPLRRDGGRRRRLMVLGLDAGDEPSALARALELVLLEVVGERVDPARVSVLSEAESPPGADLSALRRAAADCLEGRCAPFAGVDAVVHGRLTRLGDTELQVELTAMEADGRMRARTADRLPTDESGAATRLASSASRLVRFLPRRPPAPATVAGPSPTLPWIEIVIGESEAGLSTDARVEMPWWGLSTIAAGLALGIGGGLSYLEATDARDEHAQQDDCFDCRRDALDRFENHRRLSTALFVGAGVLVAVGGGLTALAVLGDAHGTSAGLRPGGAAFGWGGRF